MERMREALDDERREQRRLEASRGQFVVAPIIIADAHTKIVAP
jgi:hypothetical protein